MLNEVYLKNRTINIDTSRYPSGEPGADSIDIWIGILMQDVGTEIEVNIYI